MFFLVIQNRGEEPIAVQAKSRAELQEWLGDCALIARVTKPELLDAGWTDASIWKRGEPSCEEIENGQPMSAEDIKTAFLRSNVGDVFARDTIQATCENDQWWIVHSRSGSRWSVVHSNSTFDFEQVA